MKQITTILLTGVAAFFLSACGGGSSDSEIPSELVTITEQNADAVVASAIGSISGAMDIEDIPLLSTSSSVAKSTSIITQYAKTISTDLQISAIVTGTEACSGGGTVTYNVDDITEEGTITFNECVESDVTIDGTMELTIDGTNYIAEFIGLKIQMLDDIIFYEYAIVNLNEYNSDLSITITGYSTDGVNRMDLKDYTATITGDNLTINGLVKTSCISAWIEVKTTQALVMPGYCPIAGEVSILGNGSDIKMVFNSDESVDVSLNGQAYDSYNTCNELPSLDEVCP
ncbi:MAG: hypothetical protein WBM70_07210 [Sulfurovum sp.]|uniref:hypothetical protein n=1 Tax=Sulfurovum sp. TaxID=1969726 RepID=UPI003C752DD0